MAQNKIKFTVWLAPDILRAAKAQATLDGTTASEVLAAAARAVLIDGDRQQTDAQLLTAVERVFALIQRIDRRRGYDQQVLKEMVGLLVQSFFNHTPAIPDKDKKAALHSGKARFNRFLDTLAANLRGGQSILNDLPASQEPPPSDGTEPKLDLADAAKADLTPNGNKETVAIEKIPLPTEKSPPQTARREKSQPAETRSRWNLFG